MGEAGVKNKLQTTELRVEPIIVLKFGHREAFKNNFFVWGRAAH